VGKRAAELLAAAHTLVTEPPAALALPVAAETIREARVKNCSL
jgi:hypothetical protein